MKSQSVKETIYRLPVVGYLARSAVILLRLPVQQERLSTLQNESQDNHIQLQKKIDELEKELRIAKKKSIDANEASQDIKYQLRMMQKNVGTAPETGDTSSHKKTLADNHLLDKFYVNFEDVFRGTEADIYERLKIYLPRVQTLAKKHERPLEILDIGCGRGEFLRLMKKTGHNIQGLDLNAMMVERARKNGFEIAEEDALSFLLKQEKDSLDIISGFHLIEHIPFDELLAIFSECYRVLRPGGFVLFETPNPENLTVGSWRFYYDPSHLQPLPPDMIAFAVQSCGFEKTEVMRMHPEAEMPQKLSEKDRKIHTRLFGPLDYAVIGEKWDEISGL